MAEYVHQNLEGMLPELEEMERLGIFTRNEIRVILKRRTDFEYKLQRRVVQKPDFLKYIQYELNIDTLRKKEKKDSQENHLLKSKLNTKRLGIKTKITDGEHSAIKRIHYIYQKALRKFEDDVKLWIQYIKLCKQLKSFHILSKIIVRMLQVHPNNASLWIMAAKWEFEDNKSIPAARTLLLKGLRLNPTSQELWVEYFRMELLHVDKVRKRRRVIGLAGMDSQDEDPDSKEFLSNHIPKIVYKKAIEAVPDDVNFRLKFLAVYRLFEDTNKCQEEIYNSLTQDFPDSEEVRDVLAHRVLQEISSTDNVIMTDSMWRLGEEERDRVYEQAVQELPTVKMWDLYAKACMENFENSSPDQAERRVCKALSVFARAQNQNLLSEDMFILWVNTLVLTKQLKKATKVCKEGLQSYPQSVFLWTHLVKFNLVHNDKGNGCKDLENSFIQAVNTVTPQDSLPLWKLWIDWSWSYNFEKTEEVFKMCLGCCEDVAQVMKERYLDWAIMCTDIKRVRKLYKRLLQIKPVSLDFYKKCLKLEQSQLTVSMKRVRMLFESAVEEFGANNPDVWLDYIKIELSDSEGDSSNVGKLHWRAMKSMDGSLISDFVGQKVVESDVDPEWTLLMYLRNKLRLCGTKLGCDEGGCGACTVMVSKYDREKDSIHHMSVNACLAPVCSMHGLAVTTIEGIGSTRKKLHSIQERIAKLNGTQCGFCTPGMVMSMYSLLRNKPKPSMHEVAEYFKGNLCRCTGYRPILECMKTFTKDADSDIPCKEMTCCQSVDGKCCMLTHESGAEDASLDINPDDHFTQYNPNQEPIFPPELLLNSQLDQQSLVFTSDRTTWYRPVTLQELQQIKSRSPDAKIVVGNTTIGLEMKFKRCVYPFMIHPSHVKELNQVLEGENGITFGAAVSLDEMEIVCKQAMDTLPEHKAGVFSAIVQIMQRVAGKQIRNVASVGGNIMTGSPYSDLIPIFMAAVCKLDIIGSLGRRTVVINEEFYTEQGKVTLHPSEILLSITVPFTQQNEFLLAFKQGRRRDCDTRIVNSAFRVLLEDGCIKDIAIFYGGLGPTTKAAQKTKALLYGKIWNQDIIDAAYSCLLEDFDLTPDAAGGMVRYRKSLALSFFFKFAIFVAEKLNTEHHIMLESFKEGYRTTIQPHEKRVIKSHQFFKIQENTREHKAVGQPVPHKSAELHASGEAVYVDDMPKTENELYLAFVTSTRAHAKILNIGADKALSMNGVVDFMCYKDLREDQNITGVPGMYQDEEVFASNEVHCIGQVIGAIVARDKVTAKRAAKEVNIEYEDLPAIITMEEAIEAGSFFPDCKEIRRGNVQAALTECDQVIEGTMRTGAQDHFYLETHVYLAVPGGEYGEMVIFASTQAPTSLQRAVAKALGVHNNKVVCRAKRLGGGFGGKETRSFPLAVAVALTANKVNRPVRVSLDRDEDMMMTGWRHPFLAKYKVGFNNNGQIQAVDVELFNNAGWSNDLSFLIMQMALCNSDSAYFIPNMKVTGKCCKTNLPSNTALRGFGLIEGMMMCENWMNDVAMKLNLEPSAVRQLNLYKEGQMTHCNDTLINCTLQRCWDECLNLADYEKRKAEIQDFNAKNRWRKRGIAVLPTKFGIGIVVKFLNQAGALVNVYTDGSVLLTHGGVEMGQGLHTKMIQVASTALNIDQSKIHIAEVATDKVPNTTATTASVNSDLNGMAILDACSKILKRLEPYKTDQTKWEDWVIAAYFDRVSLSATGFYATPNMGYDIDTNSGKIHNYYTFGAGCSVVEIDCLTGDHHVIRTDIVMDLGESLNPAIDIGQIEGAFMQGYGLFVLEQMVHSPSGQLLSCGPGTYKIPSFGDVPEEFNVSLLSGSSNPHAVYSSKGVGEPPLFLGASVFFAIKDAIRSAREDAGLQGIFELESPATVERIRMACEDDITRKVPELAEGSFIPWSIQV